MPKERSFGILVESVNLSSLPCETFSNFSSRFFEGLGRRRTSNKGKKTVDS